MRERWQRGQALMEFAVVVSLLLLIVTGLVVFGEIFRAWLIIHNASREGARRGVVGGTNDEIIEVVEHRTIALRRENLAIRIDPPNEADRVVGGPLLVEVQYDVPLSIPVYSLILPNPYPLKAITIMRIEGLPQGGGGGGGGGGEDEDDDGGGNGGGGRGRGRGGGRS